MGKRFLGHKTYKSVKFKTVAEIKVFIITEGRDAY